MIEFETLCDGRVLNVRAFGCLAASEFEALGKRLATRCEDDVPIVFDWTALLSWDSSQAVRQISVIWSKSTSSRSRTAIIHGTVSHREAAIVGAIVRMSHRQIRSWPPKYREKALSWLTEHPLV